VFQLGVESGTVELCQSWNQLADMRNGCPIRQVDYGRAQLRMPHSASRYTRLACKRRPCKSNDCLPPQRSTHAAATPRDARISSQKKKKKKKKKGHTHTQYSHTTSLTLPHATHTKHTPRTTSSNPLQRAAPTPHWSTWLSDERATSPSEQDRSVSCRVRSADRREPLRTTLPTLGWSTHRAMLSPH
jgi:hypothetical protein